MFLGAAGKAEGSVHNVSSTATGHQEQDPTAPSSQDLLCAQAGTFSHGAQGRTLPVSSWHSQGTHAGSGFLSDVPQAELGGLSPLKLEPNGTKTDQRFKEAGPWGGE